jgi:UDP-2-acetamido-2,6-beta-L-arabino-hexul-4-ose reductase
MNILVTGAKGFVGKNLVQNLLNFKEGKNQTRHIHINEVYEYDIDTDMELLEDYCRNADFVYDFAGVNRPKDASEFMEGNCNFTKQLLDILEKVGNPCPVIYSSSIQASLEGRFSDSEYGKSKLEGEKAVFEYASRNSCTPYVYRFTNVFGKWCKPNYNSVVATFCYNIANDIPIQVNGRETELELLYIDDLIDEMFDVIEGKEHRDSDGKYCVVPVTHKTTLGDLVDILESFKRMPKTLIMPEIPNNSLAKKLYSTYLSYLPKGSISYPLKMNVDNRGIFTELIKSNTCGQVSINIARPGITRGQHWHNSKWEIFIVVSGHGLIQERKIGTDDVIEFEVYGEQMQAIQMLPGYTHNIINLSENENLVTIMWANELFDANKPDTFFEMVEER